MTSFVSGLFSKVVSGALGALPFTLDARISLEARSSANPLWAIYNGTKREDGTPVTVFVYDGTKQGASNLVFAQQAIKRLKTLRHPAMLKFIDSVETDSTLYLVTEPVQPLDLDLEGLRTLSREGLTWGLATIASALHFLNQNAQMVHCQIGISSIFVSKSGEWKLGGMELVTPYASISSVNTMNLSWYPFQKSLPPEIQSDGWAAAQKQVADASLFVIPSAFSGPIHAVDSFMFARLIFEILQGPCSSPDQLLSLKGVSAATLSNYKRLLQQSPAQRMSVGDFLQFESKTSGLFDNEFIQTTQFLENMQVKESAEKITFFKRLPSIMDHLPSNFAKYKLLPVLIHAIEHGSAGPKILPMILQLGEKHLTESEFKESVVGVIVRLFQSPDKAIRIMLLELLPSVVGRLGKPLINDKIYPQLITGFDDALPAVREATVKSITAIAPLIHERTLNNELFKYLVRMQTDPEPGIRANTTVCLGMITKHFTPDTRKNFILQAFGRSLRDPFPPSRMSALLALKATLEYYDAEDLATKVLPSLAHTMIDPEDDVRKHAFKVIFVIIQELEKHSNNMPQPFGAPVVGSTPTTDSQSVGSPVVSEGWAGWAANALTKSLMTSSESMSATQTTQPLTGSSHMPISPKSIPSHQSVSPNDNSNRSYSGSIAPTVQRKNSGGMSLSSTNPADKLSTLVLLDMNLNAAKPNGINSGGWEDIMSGDDWANPSEEIIPALNTLNTSTVPKNDASPAAGLSEQQYALQKKKEERRARIEQLKQQRKQIQ